MGSEHLIGTVADGSYGNAVLHHTAHGHADEYVGIGTHIGRAR